MADSKLCSFKHLITQRQYMFQQSYVLDLYNSSRLIHDEVFDKLYCQMNWSIHRDLNIFPSPEERYGSYERAQRRVQFNRLTSDELWDLTTLIDNIKFRNLIQHFLQQCKKHNVPLLTGQELLRSQLPLMNDLTMMIFAVTGILGKYFDHMAIRSANDMVDTLMHFAFYVLGKYQWYFPHATSECDDHANGWCGNYYCSDFIRTVLLSLNPLWGEEAYPGSNAHETFLYIHGWNGNHKPYLSVSFMTDEQTELRLTRGPNKPEPEIYDISILFELPEAEGLTSLLESMFKSYRIDRSYHTLSCWEQMPDTDVCSCWMFSANLMSYPKFYNLKSFECKSPTSEHTYECWEDSYIDCTCKEPLAPYSYERFRYYYAPASIPDVVAGSRASLDNVPRMVEEASNVSAVLSSTATKIGDTYNNIRESMATWLKSMKPDLTDGIINGLVNSFISMIGDDNISLAFDVLISVNALIYMPMNCIIRSLFDCALRLLAVPSAIIFTAIKFLDKAILPSISNQGEVPEAEGDDAQDVHGILDLVNLLCGKMFGNFPSMDGYPEVAKKIRTTLKQLANMTKDIIILIGGCKLIYELIMYVWNWFKGLNPLHVLLDAEGEGVMEFAELAAYFCSPTGEHLLANDPSARVLAVSMNDSVPSLRAALVEGHFSKNTQLVATLKAAFKQMEQTIAYINKLGGVRGMNCRVDPYVIYLAGKPGVGKSAFAAKIVEALKEVDELLNVPQPIYWRSHTKHWDGYTRQPVIGYDDAFALSAKVAEISHAQEWLDLCTPNQLILPMADLKNKGLTPAVRVVIACSNNMCPEPEELQEKGALLRRRHMLIDMQLKDPKNRFTHGGFIKPGTFKHLRFIRHPVSQDKAVTNSTVVKTYNDDDKFLEDLKREYHAYISSQDKTLAEKFDQGNLTHLCQIVKRDPAHFKYAKGGITCNNVECGCFEVLTLKEQASLTQIWTRSCLTTMSDAHTYLCGKTVAFREKVTTMWTHITSFLRNVGGMITKGILSMYEFGAKLISIKGLIVCLIPFTTIVAGIIYHNSGEEQPKVAEALPCNVQPASTYHYRSGYGNDIIPGAPRAESSNQLVEQEVQFLARHTYFLQFVDRNDPSRIMSCNGIHVIDKCILTVSHVLASFGDDPVDVYVTSSLGATNCWNPTDVVHWPEYDLCMIRFESLNFASKAVQKKFMVESDFAVTKHSRFGIVVKQMPNKQNKPQLDIVGVTNIYLDLKPLDYEQKGKRLQVKASWTYNTPSCPGACGSAVMLSDRNERRVGGVHIANFGKLSTGYATLVSQAIIDGLYTEINASIAKRVGTYLPIIDIQEPTVALAEATIGPVCGPNVEVLGKLDPQDQFHSPDKHELQRSMLYGKVIDPTKDVSVLHMKDPRIAPEYRGQDILYKGMSKYSNEYKELPAEYIEPCIDMMSSILASSNTEKLGDPRVLGWDEAINGIQEDHILAPQCKALEMDSSAGHGFKRPAGMRRGKRYLFKEDQFVTENGLSKIHYSLYDIDDPDDSPAAIQGKKLTRRLNEDWELIMKGIIPYSLYVGMLKPEKRTLEKIRTANTRHFTMASVVDVIIFRRLFLHMFVALRQACNQDGFAAIGIDCTGLDWHNLVKNWERYGSRGFDLDYKNFDALVSGQAAAAMAEVANRYYRDAPELQRARRIVCEQLIHAPVVTREFLMMKHQGNPSGCAATSEINCVQNFMLNAVAFAELLKRQQNEDPTLSCFSIYDFPRFVKFICYGDDVVCVPREEITSWYNPKSVSSYLTSVGHTVTAADKTKEIDFVPIKDLQFLKRTTVDVSSFYVSKLDLDSILQQIHFVRKNDLITPLEAVTVNCASVLRELWPYGRDVYDYYQTEINKALRGIGGPAITESYRFWVQNFLEKKVKIDTTSNTLNAMLVQKLIKTPNSPAMDEILKQIAARDENISEYKEVF